jgi:hypothetical protein
MFHITHIFTCMCIYWNTSETLFFPVKSLTLIPYLTLLRLIYIVDMLEFPQKLDFGFQMKTCASEIGL